MKLKSYILITLLSFCFFIFGFSIKYYSPLLKFWILSNIEEQSKNRLPVGILAKDMNLNLFPLSIEFKNIIIKPNKSLSSTLSNTKIKSIKIIFQPLKLILGKLFIKEIIISGTKSTLKIINNKEKLNLSPKFFNSIYSLPIGNIKFERSHINLLIPNKKTKLVFNELRLIFNKFSSQIHLQGISSNILFIKNNTSFSIGSAFHLIISERKTDLVFWKIIHNKSFIVLRGKMNQNFAHFETSPIQLNALFHLESINSILYQIFSKNNFPKFKGSLTGKSQIIINKKEFQSLNFRIKTKDLMVNEYTIGDLLAQGEFSSNSIQFEKFYISNFSGNFSANNLVFKLGDITSFSTTLHSSGFELQKMLLTLGVGPIPVLLDIKAEIKCRGEIHPNFQIECNGITTASNLNVTVDEKNNPFTIVKMDLATVTGDVIVNKEKVIYKAQLQVGTSSGKSHGEIDYENGFNIFYQTDNFNFTDLKYLVGINFSGITSIDGQIKGNSSTATFFMNLNSKNFWLDDFGLGDWNSKLEYRKGFLYFPNFKGHLNSSRYNGNITINLHNATLSILGIFPYVEAKDLKQVFSRKILLPIEISGSGSGKINVSGPFEFTKLTYNLESTLFRGNIAGESFDQLFFNVHAKNGEASIDRIQLVKGDSYITVSGSGHSDGNINIKIVGENFKLEESEYLYQMGLGLSGKLNFSMSLTGPIKSPHTSLQGHLTGLLLQHKKINDSQFKLKFSSNSIEGSANFLSSVITANFIVPLNEKAPLLLDIQTQEWNFIPFISILLGAKDSKDEFHSNLTSKIYLSSPFGGLWNATGKIEVNKFEISKGSSRISNSHLLTLNFENGLLNSDPLMIQGDQTQVEFRSKDSSKDHLNSSLSGKINMLFLKPLFPFINDLKGSLAFSVKATGTANKMNILGTSYIENVFVKFNDFPHPFKNIHGDFLFNNFNLAINNLSGDIAEGRIIADGNVEFKGFKDFPTKVKTTFEGVNLNIPENVNTVGSGLILITGSWFPYLVSGDYNVQNGLITKELEATKKDTTRKKILLPRFLIESQYEPFQLNIHAHLGNNLKINNSLAKATVLGSVQIKGSPLSPNLNGQIILKKGGEIYFREIPFEINSSNINLKPGDQIGGDLYITANARVKGYDVNLIVQGPSDNPKIDLTSQPQLTQENIISLLALGVTSDQMEQFAGQEHQSGIQIGTQLFSKTPLKEGLENPFGLKFQLSTDYNSINTTAPKISVTKQLTSKIEVKASRTFGESIKTEESLEYRKNENWSWILWMEQNDLEEISDTTQKQEAIPEKVGVDLRYKVEFK